MMSLPSLRLALATALLPLLAALVSCAAPPSTPAAGAAQRLHALFDEAWEADLRRHPPFATYVGDPRYGDLLDDASPEAEAEDDAAARSYLVRAQAIPRAGLSPLDASSLDVFIHSQQDDLDKAPLIGLRRMTLAANDGFQNRFAELLGLSPVSTKAEVEQMLARMAAYPRRVDQELVRLREGMALGWVPPRGVLARVIKTLDVQIAAVGETSPFFRPYTNLGSGISAAEREALQARARRAIAEQVVPAQQRLRAFVAGDYLAAAPASGSLSSYPGGAAAYAYAVRSQTTTALTPAEVHAIGLREVARLRGEIGTVMREMAWPGDFASFVHELNTNPKYFYSSPEALLAGYRDVAKRIDPELPRLFAELPRATYGVKAQPSHVGPDAAEYYEPSTPDGSRPGWFYANAEGYRNKPKWKQETLTAHETVPGHHLQGARANELGELPKFRRSIWFTAYGEGWALYAETLGFELGLYKDPASRFGHLQDQMLRAARLVVDTGIHALGWERQRAVDYMVAQTGMNVGFLESEVDRYTSDPAQALGYMIGKLKIDELRDRAKAKLGERFDIRRFHMAVLDRGAVPLSVLDRQIDEWVAAEAARR